MITPLHDELRDRAVEAAARGCAQIDRATRDYHARLKTGLWPRFDVPASVRALLDDEQLAEAA